MNESIYTNVNCENDKSCYIYPLSVIPLVMNVSNIYRFNCAINENCSIVYCNQMCSSTRNVNWFYSYDYKLTCDGILMR